MADGEIAPLKTLDELLKFKEPVVHCSLEPLRDVKRGTPSDPKILFCHDMMGGYLEDRRVRLLWRPEPGTKILNEIKEANLTSKVASQLALVAAAYKFDGWLINIESKMVRAAWMFPVLHAPVVNRQVSSVTWPQFIENATCCLSKRPPQNFKNSCFFDLCDGIFLNYAWTEEMLERSASVAGTVKVTSMSASTCLRGRRSTLAAMKRARFWDFPKHCRPVWCLSTLPLCTSFCQGFGENLYKAGKVVEKGSWFNLCKQQLQPSVACTDYAYNGGSCLLLRFVPDANKPDAKPYFRKYLVKDLQTDHSATLEEIGIYFLSFDKTTTASCLMGELVLERPDGEPKCETVRSSASIEVLEDSKLNAGMHSDEAEPLTKRQRVEHAETVASV
ncbi:hypothetical protein HPB50_017151 [Hyalomma asiaticum]|uniref:Uncharacterized protein n=1 Tax=Hyalomma asiaticum TaxID=266040 RepID=A0ACB7TEB5_HYAAI|nr:hypothetical protein HPB50_017151 [Hyalomma asiaticum]